MIAVDEVENDQVKKYGIVSLKNGEEILDMVEKPNPEDAPSNLAITGRYILQPDIFNYLQKLEIGSGGEIQLTDAMRRMCKNQPFFIKKVNEPRFDCGSVLGYLEANIAFALANPEISDQVKKILKSYSS